MAGSRDNGDGSTEVLQDSVDSIDSSALRGQAIFYSIADSPLGAKESIQDAISQRNWMLILYGRTPDRRLHWNRILVECFLECVQTSSLSRFETTDVPPVDRRDKEFQLLPDR